MTNAQPKEVNRTIQFPAEAMGTFTLNEAQLQEIINNAVAVALTKQAAPKPARSNSPYTTRGIPKAKAAEPLYGPEEFFKLADYILNHGGRYAKRNYMMLMLGCTLGCRGGDLGNTRIKDVLNADGSVKKYHETYEQKTGKYNRNQIVKQAKEAIEIYIDSLNGNYDMDDYLFKSQKGGKMTLHQMWHILNKAAAEIGLPQNIGTHTMRKTYGYIVRQAAANSGNAGSVMDLLQAKYNHSDQRITKTYLTITQDEIDGLAATLSNEYDKAASAHK